MRLCVDFVLLLFLHIQGFIAVNNVNDGQCIYTISRYRFLSTAIFQYIPTVIINQTTLNIQTDVDYYQPKSIYKQSFIRLHNLTINSHQYTNENQFEQIIHRIFIDNLVSPSMDSNEQDRRYLSRNSTHEIISSTDYKYQNKAYRRMKINVRTNDRFLGNSIFISYLLNKLLSPTKITCEITINLNDDRLENSTCQSTTAGLIRIDRQIFFHQQLNDQQFEHEIFRPLKRRTKEDFQRLLKEFCSNRHSTWENSFIDLMNNELNDEELKEILHENITEYTQCERNLLHRILPQLSRYQATEYLLKHLTDNALAMEYHFDILERQSNDQSKILFRQFIDSTCQISNSTQLRMIMIIDDDNLTIICALNRQNPWKYRAIALRILNEPMKFFDRFRTIFTDEDEPIEIRLIAFQYLHQQINSSELKNLLERIQSEEIQSFFQQKSIWLGQSGSYEFPFGRINLISSNHRPSIIQCLLANQTEIDLYFLENGELWLSFSRKSLIRFSTLNDLWNWLRNTRMFQISTLDGFMLKILFHIDWEESFGIRVRVQHEFEQFKIGYEIRVRMKSNFRIHIDRIDSQVTSYIWRAKQRENTLIQIENTIEPIFGDEKYRFQSNLTSSMKDFCYLIPHFDSKVCLSLIFERFWPSSIAIRLLADDPSLIYNLTIANDRLLFNIQQNEQIFRSYRLLRRYDQHSFIPTYLEYSSPTTNYSLGINRYPSRNLSFNFLKNHHSISHGSGTYDEDSIHLTEIFPQHLGKISIHSRTASLMIEARRLLGGELKIEIDRWKLWKSFRIRMHGQRAFFFFKQNFSTEISVDLNQAFVNLTFIRNEYDRLQWISMKNTSHFDLLFLVNTTFIQFNHQTQGYYENIRNMAIQSSSVINGWILWNISGVVDHGQEIRMGFNRYLLNMQMNSRRIFLMINSSFERIIHMEIERKTMDSIDILLELPTHRFTSHGKLIANSTNFTLDFPIIENNRSHSRIHFIFSCSSNNLFWNETFSFRHRYFLHSFWNLTFLHQYLSHWTIQSSLKMLHYPLLSFHSSAQYLLNSTTIQTFNASVILPSLFVSKPFQITYERNCHLLIEFFQWMNITRRDNHWNLSTIFGLNIFIINDLPLGISLHVEQRLLGQRYLLIIQIDRHWMISLTFNGKIRYEFLSSPVHSTIFFQRIDLSTNEIHQLPIHYYTDNQTLIRIEVLFSKYFSAFVNDFLVDVSWKNQTWKILCHIPMFRREFFLLTWQREVQQELGHFQGIIETKFLRRRRLFDYQYDWNLASIRLWKFHSRLILFSFDPIQWNMNLTNDYLWNGIWLIHSRLLLGHRRELIRFHHQYHYTSDVSNILFNLVLANFQYYLNWNYHHENQSIDGLFVRNQDHYHLNGSWNRREKLLKLNTRNIQSITMIKSNTFQSIITKPDQKLGILIERSASIRNDSVRLLDCNPSLIIHRYPQFLLIHYYTLNDGLSSMSFEWSRSGYFSWNSTGHTRIPIPVRKFQVDLRMKYLIRFHTFTHRYSAVYNRMKNHLIIRREPVDVDADDRLVLKMKSYSNRTLTIDLQVINNQYQIIAYPSNDHSTWIVQGYFQKDPFNGSVIFSDSDWFFSSKLDFNSSLIITTGRFVQFIPTTQPQIALEILFKSRFHLVFQYAGIRSLILVKFSDYSSSSNFNLYFLSKSLNDTMYHLQFQLNELINQSWILQVNGTRYYLVDHRDEFHFNGSLDGFSFEHFIGDEKNELILNENSLEFSTKKFHFLLANLSSDTSKYLHISHQPSKQNLTIEYYKFGRFARENLNIQTPIYDINLLYYPDQTRYVKIIFEFLPLQLSAFNLVRGRTFRLGYETNQTRKILSGNLALGMEDLDRKDVFIMNERWKYLYGYERHERIYIKWNFKFNVNQSVCQGRMNIEDPNAKMITSITSDINAYLNGTILISEIRTSYSETDEPIILQVNVDQRFLNQQWIAVRLLHQPSKTNLSLIFDRYPQRRLLLRIKPNDFLMEKTFIHLYANTTESQLKLLLILADLIHLNLTLPKSYPETGLLHSSIFIDNEEYFDGRLDTNALKLRTKDHLFNISINQFLVQERRTQQIRASIVARWIDRNSSTGLITIFTQTNFQRIVIPHWQSVEQQTWLHRFKGFLLSNNLTIQFSRDLYQFFDYLKKDLINKQGQFGIQLIDSFKMDENLQTGLQRINSYSTQLIETLFQISLFGENLLQEYLNNLTCLIHHQNLLHLDIIQLTNLAMHTFTYQTINSVNRTLIMFNHFTHYPRSFNAIIHYITNEILRNLHRWSSTFYLESKEYFLAKFLQYSQEIDFIIKISPLLSDSITLLSSNDLRAMIYFINDRLYRLVSIWRDSPIEEKLMKTFIIQLIEIIERFRIHLGEKLDFLLPILKISTPRIWINDTVNQTFFLTWSKQSNLTYSIDEQ